MPSSLPAHLKRYVVEQDYSRYTAIDQEIWRYIMLQLRSFLSKNAHPCYCEGLIKTGIEIDRIPDINRMSEKLEQFGWQAIPVSGFIPPAAFMELQALGFLPIASDLRTIDHILYTPAPDIVHEAAGHAPMLVDPAYTSYLKSYAQVARKAIISKQDMEQYEAIRVLSDLKESPHSTLNDVEVASNRLTQVSKEIDHLSEAAILGRMNWWTAEYGLIGHLDNPKIFGAGLLSSIGESRSCLNPKVKKIPLSIECINFGYDITEPQPQLFVTPDFYRLSEVLEQLAQTMSFRTGGVHGLKQARMAETVNTVELNSGLQISGRLSEYLHIDGVEPIYLQFAGPTQLSVNGLQISGHGTATHPNGFGMPIGHIDGTSTCLSEMSDAQLHHLGLSHGRRSHLKFRNGIEVHGEATSFVRDAQGRLQLISFQDCKVIRGTQLLFDPAWGSFDMGVGTKVTSVFGGPADRNLYGATDDFVKNIIPRKALSPLFQVKQKLAIEIKEIRIQLESDLDSESEKYIIVDRLEKILDCLESDFPHEWLLRLAILELTTYLPASTLNPRIELELNNLGEADPQIKSQIEDGKSAFAKKWS
jgi:phenylalanine-4-hydroxylase